MFCYFNLFLYQTFTTLLLFHSPYIQNWWATTDQLIRVSFCLYLIRGTAHSCWCFHPIPLIDVMVMCQDEEEDHKLANTDIKNVVSIMVKIGFCEEEENPFSVAACMPAMWSTSLPRVGPLINSCQEMDERIGLHRKSITGLQKSQFCSDKMLRFPAVYLASPRGCSVKHNCSMKVFNSMINKLRIRLFLEASS